MITKTKNTDFTNMIDGLIEMNYEKYECSLCFDSLYVDGNPCNNCKHKLHAQRTQQEIDFIAMLESENWNCYGERVLNYALSKGKITQELYDKRNYQGSMFLRGITGTGKTLLSRHVYEKEPRLKRWVEEDDFFNRYRTGKHSVKNDMRLDEYNLVILDEFGQANNWSDQHTDRERSNAGHREFKIFINELYKNRSCRVIFNGNRDNLDFISDPDGKYMRRFKEIFTRGKK